MTLYFETQEELSLAIAQQLAVEISAAVKERGSCHVVFPGGNSPKAVFSLLREERIDWQALYLYPSDERCVPPQTAERNDLLIEELLFDKVPFPPANLKRMPAELGADRGAKQYCELLQRTPVFDIALLGMGPDGHTASLFPGHSALLDEADAVAVHNAPKLPSERISIGTGRLHTALQRWMIVNDPSKKKIMDEVLAGADYPVKNIYPNRWFVCISKPE